MNSLILAEIVNVQWLKRLAAQIIDFALVFLTTVSIFMIFPISESLPFSLTLISIFLPSSILLDMYYHGTIGKLYLNLHVVNASGQPVNLRSALYRNLMKVVVAFVVWEFIAAIGWTVLILMWIGRLGFHNKIAGCVVIDMDSRKDNP